jgi:hypothetical protein
MTKLVGYCLNPDHPRGRHKARVFAHVLGLSAHDAEVLRDALLRAAQQEEAVAAEADSFGQRYDVDFIMQGLNGSALVRSCWIVRADEDIPRLVSCYVL